MAFSYFYRQQLNILISVILWRTMLVDCFYLQSKLSVHLTQAIIKDEIFNHKIVYKNNLLTWCLQQNYSYSDIKFTMQSLKLHN